MDRPREKTKKGFRPLGVRLAVLVAAVVAAWAIPARASDTCLYCLKYPGLSASCYELEADGKPGYDWCGFAPNDKCAVKCLGRCCVSVEFGEEAFEVEPEIIIE